MLFAHSSFLHKFHHDQAGTCAPSVSLITSQQCLCIEYFPKRWANFFVQLYKFLIQMREIQSQPLTEFWILVDPTDKSGGLYH
jgi:hypothetical protein